MATREKPKDDATFPGTFSSHFLSHASLPEFPDICRFQLLLHSTLTHPKAFPKLPTSLTPTKNANIIWNQVGPTLLAPWLQRFLILIGCCANVDARGPLVPTTVQLRRTAQNLMKQEGHLVETWHGCSEVVLLLQFLKQEWLKRADDSDQLSMCLQGSRTTQKCTR